MGFDLVAFSGGKGLRGPQCSGLLLGRKDLVEAAFLNGSPFSDSIGRGAKVGKEEIVGLLTALELFLKRNHAAEWAEWERRVKYIADTVTKVPGVTAEREVPEIANQVPHLAIRWDPSKVRLTNRQVALELREGNPRIELRPGSDREVTPPLLHVGVWMMQPGEHVVLARRLREVLEKGARG
jgi:L-seryl-tRNA(Ser) seleniumtransferase